MVESTPDLGNFAYIPLSGLIILLVILLTCASRRKKLDPLSAIEPNLKNDIKGEYVILCFPCLKKKPNLAEFEPTEDLNNQFEYIVEKYTIRKVPLLLVNTAEDLLERQNELKIAKNPQSQFVDDHNLNFQVSQEVYNVQKIPPCITFGASTSCRGSKSIKERPVPSDILESMSPVTRLPIRSHNYVAIPTKGSLRHKDIMMTKREITNQYLNNFSSVFVDNLKDQVPKDPEQFPRLSRPYSSAYRNYPINEAILGRGKGGKKSKKAKYSKVAYAYPLEESNIEENSISEEAYFESDSAQEQMTTDVCEFPEDTEHEVSDSESKSKSLAYLKYSESVLDGVENLPNPFKTILKSTDSRSRGSTAPTENNYRFLVSFKQEDWPCARNVTYDDIQALDVGYEFSSCEKLGVKPKMTRIHCPVETEKFKESIKLGLGDSLHKVNKNPDPQEKLEAKTEEGKTSVTIPETTEGVLVQSTNTLTLFPTQGISSRSFFTETSFLPLSGSVELETVEAQNKPSFVISKCEGNKTRSLNEIEINNDTPVNMTDSIMEIRKMSQMPKPAIGRTNFSKISADLKETEEDKKYISSKSRSFHEPGIPDLKKETGTEVKGKGNLPYQKSSDTNSLNKVSRSLECDTETTYSLETRDSKMSVMTSAKSSENDEEKRTTLRWKIIIKHHKEHNSLKKHENKNN